MAFSLAPPGNTCAPDIAASPHPEHALKYVAFIHRFDSSLNSHVHSHVCVIDGVFEAISGDDKTVLAIPSDVNFHPASGLDEAAVAQAQAAARTRILRAFVGCGLIESFDAKEMLACQHSGFSVDAGVCIEAHDRARLERLLRYCARPPFSMERMRQRGADRVYHCPKPQSGGKQADLLLMPLVLIDRIAARVPPPRTHRHRYFGGFAPNSPLMSAVTALAQPALLRQRQSKPARATARTGWRKRARPWVVALNCP